MTPTPNREDDLVRRMDTLERRQDDRHRENQSMLREVQQELKPLSTSLRSIVGDENYPGRMRIAENDIEAIKDAVNGINKTIAKWSGAIIVLVTLLGLLEKIVFKN